MEKITKINSLEELKQICDGKMKDFSIQLNFCIRISYDSSTDKFYIINLVDNSKHELNSNEIMGKSNSIIRRAIEFGAFFQY